MLVGKNMWMFPNRKAIPLISSLPSSAVQLKAPARIRTAIPYQKKAAPLLGPQFKRGKRKEVRKGDARGRSGGRIG